MTINLCRRCGQDCFPMKLSNSPPTLPQLLARIELTLPRVQGHKCNSEAVPLLPTPQR